MSSAADTMGEEAVAYLALPETRRILNRTIQDAMRGGAPGALRDIHLYTHPWDIDFAAIALPVRIWHGEADGTVPLAHGR